MQEQIKFDTYLLNSSTSRPVVEGNFPIFSATIKNVTFYNESQHVEEPLINTSGSTRAIVFTAFSTVSTLALIYILTKDLNANGNSSRGNVEGRSTALPGYGILGDKVNEVLEMFLDALAVYVHNDNKWECQRRMLCEANQRAGEYGVVQGVVMYFLSLGVSLLLQNQRVSDSLEAMQIGRRGGDCTQLYPKCPFSL